MILTQIRSGSDDTGGGVADDDGAADDAGRDWLLDAELDGLPCDTGGIEIGAWCEMPPCDDTSGLSGSVLDSGKLELSRVDDSGRPDTSGRDTADGGDGRLADDIGLETGSRSPPPCVTATMIAIIIAKTASNKPTIIMVFFGLDFLFSSMLSPRD